jgi:hypothetical protein
MLTGPTKVGSTKRTGFSSGLVYRSPLSVTGLAHPEQFRPIC